MTRAPTIAKRVSVTLNVLERPVCVPLIHKRTNVTLHIAGESIPSLICA